MSEAGGFSIDQLMELAGLSVAQTVFRLYAPQTHRRVLIVAGPGANGILSPRFYIALTRLGGDGLVAARHLKHFGYTPTVLYPKPSRPELYDRLQKQLTNLAIPIEKDAGAIQTHLDSADCVIDAVFGFSFSGEVREPFVAIIAALAHTAKPILAVDNPSSWAIDDGPAASGPGRGYMPHALLSLTAPKPCARYFQGHGRPHFLGGRFVPPHVADEFRLQLPMYPGSDQIVDISSAELVQA